MNVKSILLAGLMLTTAQIHGADTVLPAANHTAAEAARPTVAIQGSSKSILKKPTTATALPTKRVTIAAASQLRLFSTDGVPNHPHTYDASEQVLTKTTEVPQLAKDRFAALMTSVDGAFNSENLEEIQSAMRQLLEAIKPFKLTEKQKKQFESLEEGLEVILKPASEPQAAGVLPTRVVPPVAVRALANNASAAAQPQAAGVSPTRVVPPVTDRAANNTPLPEGALASTRTGRPLTGLTEEERLAMAIEASEASFAAEESFRNRSAMTAAPQSLIGKVAFEALMRDAGHVAENSKDANEIQNMINRVRDTQRTKELTNYQAEDLDVWLVNLAIALSNFTSFERLSTSRS